MKRTTKLDVSVDDVLKAKRQTIVFTRQDDFGNRKVDNQEVACTSSYNITFEEVYNDNFVRNNISNVPSTLENRGQPIVDELKKLNLGTIKKPKTILVST